jgi:hypothetical protein
LGEASRLPNRGRRRPFHISGPMVTISISAEALAAIEATLPEESHAETPPGRQGLLFGDVAAQRESYSENAGSGLRKLEAAFGRPFLC